MKAMSKGSLMVCLPVGLLVGIIVLAQSPNPAKNAVGMEFVKIAAGEFMMGCSTGDNDCDADEKPAHRVQITKAFEIGKYEVTQAQWQAVMGSNPSTIKGDDHPVETDLEERRAGFSRQAQRAKRRLPLPSAHRSGMGIRGQGRSSTGCRHPWMKLPGTRDNSDDRNASGRPEETQRLGSVRHVRQRAGMGSDRPYSTRWDYPTGPNQATAADREAIGRRPFNNGPRTATELGTRGQPGGGANERPQSPTASATRRQGGPQASQAGAEGAGLAAVDNFPSCAVAHGITRPVSYVSRRDTTTMVPL